MMNIQEGRIKVSGPRIIQWICSGVILGFIWGCRADKAAWDHASSKKSAPAEGSQGALASELAVTLDQSAPASIVKVLKVRSQVIETDIEVLGSIASDTDQVIQVRPEGSGKVQELLTSVGDNIETGQVILRYAPEADAAPSKELKASGRGIVIGLYVDSGDHVDPAVPVATLADISRVRCILDVFDKDISRIRKGQLVFVRANAYPGETFEGRVAYISPRVNENSRTFKVRVDISNPRGELRFGMFVEGHITVGQKKALALPETAVQYVDGGSRIFVSTDCRRFTARLVSLGQELSRGLVEVASGLKEGECVVSQGGFLLLSEIAKNKFKEEDKAR